jgi:hypothetical protein
MLVVIGGPIDYSTAGRLTELAGSDPLVLGVDGGPVEICWPVHSLVIQPDEAKAIGLPADRFEESQRRPAGGLVARLLEMDPAPLTIAREPERRVVGTCRHFAVLACALLRHRRISSRVRCGFATYFQPGKGLDHWIVEYYDPHANRWVRVDPEVLGQSVVEHPEDLRSDEFLSGGEAWAAFRRGGIDASSYGVYGSENWGPGEIRGNLVKDLAALNKVEMLPWDEWGRMTEAYEGKTGDDYDELLDSAAAACAVEDCIAMSELYALPELLVPERLIR